MMKAMKYYLNCLVTCVTYPAAEAACEARRGPLLAGGPSCRHPATDNTTHSSLRRSLEKLRCCDVNKFGHLLHSYTTGYLAIV